MAYNVSDSFQVMMQCIEDPLFTETLRRFEREHCREFEEQEENKLSYTIIHQQYIQLIEMWIEGRMAQVIEGFSMEAFLPELNAFLQSGGADIKDVHKAAETGHPLDEDRRHRRGVDITEKAIADSNKEDDAARLGSSVALLGAVGDDAAGRALLHGCGERGIDVQALEVLKDSRTATYTALLDGKGELVGAVADMAILDAISAESVSRRCDDLAGTSLVLCEANLSPATLEAALQSCRRQQKPAWYDPVSVAKAPRGCLSPRWDLAAPNCDELLAMLGKPPGVMLDWEARREGLPSALRAAIVEALSTDSGFADRLLLSLGPRGCVLASRADVAKSSSSNQREHLRDLSLDVAAMLTSDDTRKLPLLHLQLQEPLHESGCELLWYRLLKPADTVRDVTGAGDALLAGAAAAFVAGWPLEEAIVAGMVAAHATLFVDGSVSPQLHPKLLPTLQSLLRARRSRL
ncbi:psuK [Symbiodinium sp. KB8]|nr:psuK [Symbiodinium sp. KB8]